jgi:hypothetical protein
MAAEALHSLATPLSQILGCARSKLIHPLFSNALNSGALRALGTVPLY